MTVEDETNPDVKLWYLVYIGESLCDLQQCSNSRRLGWESDEQPGVALRCRNLLEAMTRFELGECYKKVGLELRGLIDRFSEILATNPHATIGDAAVKLRGLMARLRRYLRDEGNKRTIFVTMPAGEIAVEDMLVPERWFKATFGSLKIPPEHILRDFQEAAHCFAAGFAPSAILFALRATEGMLYHYYEHVTGKQTTDMTGKQIIDWSNAVKNLAAKNCPEQLTIKLDDLRKMRNAAMHPGQRDATMWGQEAVKIIFEDCASIIIDMVIDLEKTITRSRGCK
jgi:hypothetical protein